MSRIGKKPITLESDIKVQVTDSTVTVAGPQGQLELKLPAGIGLNINQNQVDIRNDKGKEKDHLTGLYRTLVQNAVTGVKNKWKKTLELVGVGYRANVNGANLVLNLGFSHPVTVPAPEGISFQVNESKITVSGVNKYLVGEVAATVRRIKPPEPYKGKGIRYEGEYIRKKLGKAAKAVGGAAAAK